MPFIELSDSDKCLLKSVAHDSIQHGLGQGKPLLVTAKDYSMVLQLIRATFVTLTKAGELRGCIGTLVAIDPLIEDVAKHAYAAAFQDPRFPKLGETELAEVTLEISILTPPEPFEVESEQDLINQVRPGIDGLVLEAGPHKGTFLPSVWDQLPKPEAFIQHLKLKAGLPASGWPEMVSISRYQAQKI